MKMKEMNEIVAGFELSANSKECNDDTTQSNEKLNNIYKNHNFQLVKYGKNNQYSYSLRELKIDE